MFVVAYSEEVPDCNSAELMVHARLKSYRILQGREFFRLPLRDAIQMVAQVASEIRQSIPEAANSIPLAEPKTEEHVNTLVTKLRLIPSIPPGPDFRPFRIGAKAIKIVLRKHFGAIQNAYIRPAIPERKLQGVSDTYGKLLQNDEYVFLVYDGSWLGSATSGIILTDHGIGWAETYNSPNYCEYVAVKPDEVCDGWTGFFVQGDKKASVYAKDTKQVAAALRDSLREIRRELLKK